MLTSVRAVRARLAAGTALTKAAEAAVQASKAVDKSGSYCRGGCGPGVCVNNRCFCPTGFSGANCRTLRTGPLTSRCGNNCNNQGKCVLGNCYCFPGFGGKNCEKAEPLSCPSNCNSHGTCHRGMCFCDAGYEGLDCGIVSKCEPGCVEGGRGICMNGKCQCVQGFSGSICNVTLGTGAGEHSRCTAPSPRAEG
jgi:hypothetical protein